MPTDTVALFRELYELYRLTYFVYLAGDELRAKTWDHTLLRYLRDLDATQTGREFLQEFANYDGDDPSLSVIRIALVRYHAALALAAKE